MTEPREVTVKRYRCAFCPRGYSVRKRAVEHMQGCRHNPANQWQVVEPSKALDPRDPNTWGF